MLGGEEVVGVLDVELVTPEKISAVASPLGRVGPERPVGPP